MIDDGFDMCDIGIKKADIEGMQRLASGAASGYKEN